MPGVALWSGHSACSSEPTMLAHEQPRPAALTDRYASITTSTSTSSSALSSSLTSPALSSSFSSSSWTRSGRGDGDGTSSTSTCGMGQCHEYEPTTPPSPSITANCPNHKSPGNATGASCVEQCECCETVEQQE